MTVYTRTCVLFFFCFVVFCYVYYVYYYLNMLTQQSVIQDASSCDADDEEPENDYDTVLDLSCKSQSNEQSSLTTISKKETLKRKHLRKKRSDKHNITSERPLPNVLVSNTISFVNDNTTQQDNTSSSDEDEATRLSRRRRNKRAVYLREDSFDVDEHFRRSLGGVWDTIGGNGGTAGVSHSSSIIQSVNSGLGTPSNSTIVVQSNEVSSGTRIVFEESIKPSDVDDHFAKALGSETWSKIVQSRASSTTRASRSRSRSPVRVFGPENRCKSPVVQQPPPPPTTTTTLPPPPPYSSPPRSSSSSSIVQSSRPNPTISNSSNIFKIDAILGNNRAD